MGQETTAKDIGSVNKMKVMEMVTTIVAAAAGSAKAATSSYYVELVKNLYPPMVKLLEDDGVVPTKVKIGAV